jgi:integrase
MRSRYQEGTLRKMPRKSGHVWEYRFREKVNGKVVERTRVIGTVKDYRTEAAARRAVELIRVNLNANAPAVGPVTPFKVLSAHYCQREMPMDNHEDKAYSTKKTNYGYLRKWILPKWGEYAISQITPVMVEERLRTALVYEKKHRVMDGDNVELVKVKQKLANGSKVKIRNLMSAIYRHAMRHGFINDNPIKLVRQGAKRSRVPEILELEEIRALLAAVQLRERTMILMDLGAGLRRGELFGLMWMDIDFEKKIAHVRRSIVDNVPGKVKTEVSEKPMPLDDYILADLVAWYAATPYKKPTDYVFATDSNRAGDKRGKQPVRPNKVLDYWIKPVAKQVGITKKLGWHTFRHTFSNLLRANNEDVKTVQELLRHAVATR